MRKNTTALLLAVSLIAVAGCAKKQKPEDLPPPPIGADGNTGANTTPAGPAPGSQADFVASVMADRIYFDTDKSDIDAEDQATLNSQAEWLKKYPGTRVTIEGFSPSVTTLLRVTASVNNQTSTVSSTVQIFPALGMGTTVLEVAA